MKILINTKIGENRGSSRIWLEQAAIGILGKPGERLSLSLIDNALVLRVAEKGQVLLSKRTGRNSAIEKLLVEVRDKHLVDAVGKTIKDIFPHSKDLRIIVKLGVMIVKPGLISLKRLFSVNNIIKKLKNNERLSITTMYAGGGIFDKALHQSFSKAGIESKVDLLIEREKVYVDSLITNQPELLSEDCLILQSDTRDLQFGSGEHSGCDVFLAAIPCTASSAAGRAKKSLSKPEDDPDAGNTIIDTINYITQFMPPVFVMENERSYKNTASFSLLVNRLKYLSYDISFEVLDGLDFGGFEPRRRVFLVANLLGSDFNFANLPRYSNIRTIDSITEDVPSDSDMYKTYDHLITKLKRDKEKGSGFSMYLHHGSERHLKRIIRRLYSKAGSCEPFLLHPSDHSKFRLFTSKENARLRDVDPSVVKGLPESRANEVLGQSGVFTVFTSLFDELACFLKQLNLKAAY